MLVKSCVTVAGIRRRDRRTGHSERGLVQRLDADNAAAARQPDAVDVRHSGRRRRARRGRRQLTRAAAHPSTRICSHCCFIRKRVTFENGARCGSFVAYASRRL